MKMSAIGYAQLDARISLVGEEGVLADVASRVAVGELPSSIAASYGMPYVCLRKFLEDKGMGLLELARRAYADELVMRGIVVARDSGMETLGVDKFQAEYYQKTAALMSKKEWGNEKESSGNSGITVIVDRTCGLEVEGGVLRISSNENKGYPDPVVDVIDGISEEVI